jgi:Arc/MetJ-type ribon-helix-helix transcriptional regulator
VAALTVRLDSNLLRRIDSWRARQEDRPSRPEAIRRLVASKLGSAARKTRPGATAKIAKIAGRQLDRLGDRTASRKERAIRKQRLLEGPREFRRIRTDLPE